MKQPHAQVSIEQPKKCDFCNENGVDRDALYDGKVSIGTFWANMCQGHFELYGLGLGLGVGQKLIVRQP